MTHVHIFRFRDAKTLATAKLVKPSCKKRKSSYSIFLGPVITIRNLAVTTLAFSLHTMKTKHVHQICSGTNKL